MKLHLVLALCAVLFAVSAANAAEPDTLIVFDAASETTGALPANWEHVLPGGDRVYSDYSVERSIDGNFLRARSSGTSSYLELDLGKGGINPEEYSKMRWQWKALKFPEVEYEENAVYDDFTLRVELVYDFKGSALNPLNLIRKGLITSLFKWYPPERIISYVWAVNVPIAEPYTSPNEKRTTVIPVQSSEYIVDRWMTEEIDIFADISKDYPAQKLYLKKIRIRADSDNTTSITESGLKFIRLIKGQ